MAASVRPQLGARLPSHLVALAILAGAAPVVGRGQEGSGATRASSAKVELHCKLVAPRRERTFKAWRVELRASSGEPLRAQAVGGGGTARFRDLAPGIYVLCVSDDKRLARCESLDLTPAPQERARRFDKEFQLPVRAPADDTHRVDARALAVPERARRELVRAEDAALRGDRDRAVAHLERALEIHPEYSDALNNLGTHHHRSGNYERSVQYFTRVTEIDPLSFPGWVNLGGSLLALGRLQPALAANQRAVRLRPRDALGNSQLAMNYFYLHRYDEAKPFFEKVLALDPLSANTPQLFLAQIAMATRQPREAERQIRNFLALHPHSPRNAALRRTLESLASRPVTSNRENAFPAQ